MDVRILKQQELLPALHLVWEVFAEDVAPLYTPEGVHNFQEFIKFDNINLMYQKGEIAFFGAFEGVELKGVMAVRSFGHICLFYVRKECQGRGIGRKLFEAVKTFAIRALHVSQITVNSAPDAVIKYQKLGFIATAPEQCVDGIRYVPMQCLIEEEKPKKKSREPLIAAIIAGCIILLALFILGTYKLVKGVFDYVDDRGVFDRHPGTYREEPYDNGGGDVSPIIPGDGAGDEADAGELSGLEAVPAYTASGLTYKIEDESYTFSDKEKKTMLIDFNVKYPQISGLDNDVQKKINKILKECAMETVDKIYTNPSDETKEKVLAAEIPALVSYVEYKVSYSGKDFISVIYQDYSYQGDSKEYYVDLRTKNINLKDGTVYEVKDIVDLSDEFMNEWITVMRSEAGNNEFLSELDKDAQKKALEGDSLNGVYNSVFFVDSEGLEIGYSLNYPKGDAHDLGYAWVTAPFSFDSIRKYETKSDFYKALD